MYLIVLVCGCEWDRDCGEFEKVGKEEGEGDLDW